jgi:hypothetical protein
MTSLLIAARDEETDGAGFTDEELRDPLILMINAGYETTVNVIDQAVFAMLTSPDQLELVRTGRAGWDDVVEETLRHEPAIKYLPLRFAVTDVDLPDGQTITAGDPILAAYAAANRHPEWHGPDADTFDVTRRVKDHLAFGYGVHFCLGAPLWPASKSRKPGAKSSSASPPCHSRHPPAPCGRYPPSSATVTRNSPYTCVPSAGPAGARAPTAPTGCGRPTPGLPEQATREPTCPAPHCRACLLAADFRRPDR